MMSDYIYTYKPVDDLTQYCDEMGRVLPEYRDKEFWIEHLDEFRESRLIGISKRDSVLAMVGETQRMWRYCNTIYTRTPKPKPIPIPPCVPDGWWVWSDRYRWYASEGKPTLALQRSVVEWVISCDTNETYALQKVFYPELYAWDGPIEQACVQVDKSNL